MSTVITRSEAGRRPSSRWNHARGIFRRGGAGALVARLLRRSLSRLVSWQTILFFVADRVGPLELPEVRARIPLEVRLAQDGDWELVRDFAVRTAVPARTSGRGDPVEMSVSSDCRKDG